MKGGFWEDSMRSPIGTNGALRDDWLGRESSQHSTLSNLPEKV